MKFRWGVCLNEPLTMTSNHVIFCDRYRRWISWEWFRSKKASPLRSSTQALFATGSSRTSSRGSRTWAQLSCSGTTLVSSSIIRLWMMVIWWSCRRLHRETGFIKSTFFSVDELTDHFLWIKEGSFVLRHSLCLIGLFTCQYMTTCITSFVCQRPKPETQLNYEESVSRIYGSEIAVGLFSTFHF